jgi:hypothetical protein
MARLMALFMPLGLSRRSRLRSTVIVNGHGRHEAGQEDSMTTERPPMPDTLPDRLSTNPHSPHYNEELLKREVGIRFKGVEKTNVEEYCVSEGWIRVSAG